MNEFSRQNIHAKGMGDTSLRDLLTPLFRRKRFLGFSLAGFIILALLTTMAFWGGLYIALTGRPAYRLLNLIPGKYILWPLLVFGVFAWAWKIAIHVTGHDGWG